MEQSSGVPRRWLRSRLRVRFESTDRERSDGDIIDAPKALVNASYRPSLREGAFHRGARGDFGDKLFLQVF
jgi:hypothetical protein